MFFFVLQSSISKFPEGGFVCVNCLKTFLLIMFLAVVMLLVGNFVAVPKGFIAFILAMLMNIVTYFFVICYDQHDCSSSV